MTKENRCQWFGLVSILPEMFEAISHYGITGKAVKSGLVEIHTFNPRDFATDRHLTVDDKPFGGGGGMLLMAEPVRSAIAAAVAAAPAKPRVIYLTPQGRPVKQQDILALCSTTSLVLLAGRYEGVDERVIELDVDEQLSIGDYVLTGGELPAMVLMDAMIRLLPGAVGNTGSIIAESFHDGLLDYPQFTRPRCVNNLKVPEVLVSGNRQEIDRWRRKQALGRTLQRRPDMLKNRQWSEQERRLLEEYLQEERDSSTDCDV